MAAWGKTLALLEPNELPLHFLSGCTESRAVAPAWGCEALLELEAAGSVDRLKASRVGHLIRLGTCLVPSRASQVSPGSPGNPRKLLE